MNPYIFTNSVTVLTTAIFLPIVAIVNSLKLDWEVDRKVITNNLWSHSLCPKSQRKTADPRKI